jgi:DNA primase
LRDGRGATAVAAYSTCAKPAATASAPIAWEELSASLHSDHFTIENLPGRLSTLKQDPWADMARTKQSTQDLVASGAFVELRVRPLTPSPRVPSYRAASHVRTSPAF